MRIVLLGPPGAGKGTQADRLSERFGWKKIATGDIFRAALSEGTPLGLEAKKYMESGELVPDEIVEGIVAERLGEEDVRESFILDGFPRSLHQAHALDEMLADDGKKLDIVLNLRVDTETLVKRLTGRRVCRVCGANFHLAFGPPSREGVCDFCGGELYRRDDDDEGTVRSRLNVYREQTEPVIDYYSARGILHNVDGEGTPDEVFGRICRVIESKAGGA